MKYLPSEIKQMKKEAVEEFKETGKFELCEPCNCGMQIRHNNGGNYHEWFELQVDENKLYLKEGTTCELVSDEEWYEIGEIEQGVIYIENKIDEYFG